MKNVTGIQNDAHILSGSDTPNGEFNNMSVQQGQGVDITASAIHDLNSNAPKLNLPQRTMEQPQSSEAKLADVARDLKETSMNLVRLQEISNLNARELEEKTKALEAERKLFEVEIQKSTEGGLGEAKFKRLELHVRILNEIQGRLPLLVKEYEAIKTNNSTEARTKFVNYYIAEIGSAFKNIVAQEENQANIVELKSKIESSIALVEVFKGIPEVTAFVKLALQQIQDPAAKPIDPKLYVKIGVWMYNLLDSLKAFIALTGAYMLGKSEAYILSLLPLAVKNLVAAVMKYAGSPTVPLLCFGVAYALYLLVQVGAAAKERKWPTEAKVAEEAQKVAITKLFAQNAIVV
ncbi:MAG: hypothetical protein C5B43_04920 [Verrucomicrobia bacterium]|nr:MAG: hypothetical protein C5B43_04920 [Verrucomicrobiota bacterium]